MPPKKSSGTGAAL
jgi:hypothetical protein